MRKIAVLFLVLALVTSFASCTSATVSEGGKDNENTQTDIGNTEGKDNESSLENVMTFTETVAVDNDECSIKVTGIDTDSIWGYTLKVLLENKSADRSYMFTVDKASINGVECTALFASTVAAGKKSNDTVTFSDDKLKENKISDYTDIELTFRVYDSEDFLSDDVAKETVHIYPYGEDKAVKFVRDAQPTDNVIVDNEYVTAIVTGYEEDAILGYGVSLFLVNKTDKNLMFTTENTSVNGFMADPFFATSVSAGKCAFNSITWFTSTFEENGITDVETIEFDLRAYDLDDLLAKDIVNEAVTLNP